jgi:Phosphorylated CTD interacting factor 1 WW domain
MMKADLVHFWLLFQLPTILLLSHTVQVAVSFHREGVWKYYYRSHLSSFETSCDKSRLAGSTNDNNEPPKWNRPPSSSNAKTLVDIWAGLAIEDFHSATLAEAINQARSQATQRAGIRPVHPIDEQTRYEAFNRLRQRMFDLVRGENCDSRRGWIRSFERWQFTSKTFEGSLGGNIAFLDPLLPSVAENNPAEQNLFEDLKKLENMTEEGARRISRRLQVDSANLSDALYKRMLLRIEREKELGQSPSVKDIDAEGEENIVKKALQFPVSVISNQYNGDMKVALEGASSADKYSKRVRTFTISAAHAAKLRQLWDYKRSRTKQQVAERNGHEEVTAADDGSALRCFEEDLFSLLARYSVLEGYGWQAAVAQPVLAAMHKHFGVSVECFSSPLNSYMPTFCSLFPDTDAQFGSLGSFFDFNPLEGSFEANPPFVMPLMIKMVKHMEQLLSAATGPMSFAVVVPAWEDDAHWPLLVGSAFTTGSFTVLAADHSYCDGGQHENSLAEKYRPAPFNTAVFFLQNKLGSELWPMTPASEGELRSAFAAARASEEALQNQRSRGLYVPASKIDQEQPK